MGQRHDRHTHASRRKREETINAASAPKAKTRDQRMPLAGYEGHFEITRDGRIYSLKTHAFLVPGYARSAFVRFPVNGTVVSLPKQKAITESWEAKTPEPE